MNSKLPLAFFLLLLSSCSYKLQKAPEEGTGKFSGALGFSTINREILGPKCSRCHGNEWVGDYDATKALLGKISERIQSTAAGVMMPPQGNPALTADEKAAVLAWIARGAPLDPGEVVLPPPELQKNFAGVSRKVLGPKCLRCHDEDFDTYEHVKPFLPDFEFRIVGAMGTGDQMPPQDQAQLTEEEKTFILDWLRAGAPEE